MIGLQHREKERGRVSADWKSRGWFLVQSCIFSSIIYWLLGKPLLSSSHFLIYKIDEFNENTSNILSRYNILWVYEGLKNGLRVMVIVVHWK